MTISSLVPTSTTPDPKGKFPVLLSYAYARQKPEEFALFANNPHVEVLLDSGAFTALNSGEEIHLKDYMAFLEMWRDKLFGYLALDVLGDPVGTDVNLRVMRNAGFKPEVAGGITAAAAAGGALVPPVMGAGAYMMLEFVERDPGQPQVTFLEIAKAALIPAVLYYLSICTTHLCD